MKTLCGASGVLVSAGLLMVALPASADGVLSLRIDGPKVRVSYALPLGGNAELGVDKVRVRLGGLRVFESDLDGNIRSAPSDWSMLGDYYFRKGSGLRATGGVLRAERDRGRALESPWSGDATEYAQPGQRSKPGLRLNARSLALPYIGMGYSEPAARGNWGFFADVGMVMLKPKSSVKLGAASGGSWLSYTDARRDGEVDLPRQLGDWRLSPVIQMGVSYAF